MRKNFVRRAHYLSNVQAIATVPDVTDPFCVQICGSKWKENYSESMLVDQCMFTSDIFKHDTYA